MVTLSLKATVKFKNPVKVIVTFLDEVEPISEKGLSYLNYITMRQYSTFYLGNAYFKTIALYQLAFYPVFYFYFRQAIEMFFIIGY